MMARLPPLVLVTLTAFAAVGAADAQTWRAMGPPPRYGHCLGHLAGRTWLVGGTTSLGAVTLHDVWEYGAARWTERTPPGSSPGPRVHAAMASSSTRNRLVMVGGATLNSSGAAIPLSDICWEFDGQSWQQRTFPVSPPARYAHAMVEDAYRGCIVLFGGYSATNARLGDTWEYDGTTWTQRTLPQSPPGNAEHAMVFDLATGTTLSYGGIDTRVWSYDGSTWHQIVTATQPNRTLKPVMWFDGNRGAVMLLDALGATSGRSRTLEFQRAGDWTVVNTTDAPSNRAAPVVFDWTRQRAVLFGGNASDGIRADTWEFDGNNWSVVPDATVGLLLGTPAVAYDSNRRCCVVVGAATVGVASSCTYEWDGSAWSQRTTAHEPTIMGGQQIAYDSRRQRTVLFGDATGPVPGAFTWEYDGTDWQALQHLITPPWRLDHAMAYDSVRGRIVLFGGIASGARSADTWEYDGTRWFLRAPRIGDPVPRCKHAMAYDVARRVMVMYGGEGAAGSLAETWLYDGNWQQVNGANGPGARTLHTMSYDPTQGRVVLYGGKRPFIPLGTNDLFAFDGTQWLPLTATSVPPMPPDDFNRYQALVQDGHFGHLLALGAGVWQFEPVPLASWTTYGPGCAVGTNPSLALAGATSAGPTQGTSFAMTLTTTPAQPGLAWLVFGEALDQWRYTPLPVDLGPIGGPGCLLWVPADDGVLVSLPSGTATLLLPVPVDPRLADATFGAQAVLVDSNAATLFGGMSNAIAVRIQ